MLNILPHSVATSPTAMKTLERMGASRGDEFTVFCEQMAHASPLMGSKRLTSNIWVVPSSFST